MLTTLWNNAIAEKKNLCVHVRHILYGDKERNNLCVSGFVSPITTNNPLIPKAQWWLSVAALAGACLIIILIKGFGVVHSPGPCAGGRLSRCRDRRLSFELGRELVRQAGG